MRARQWCTASCILTHVRKVGPLVQQTSDNAPLTTATFPGAHAPPRSLSVLALAQTGYGRTGGGNPPR